MMSNETKRDVFDQTLTLYRSAVNVLNENGLDEVYDIPALHMLANYDAALPDDLPVIPKAVSDYINDAKASHYELLDAMAKWTLDQPVFDWIHENSDAFARAWLDGYEVEANEP